jgi:hypothetical protein
MSNISPDFSHNVGYLYEEINVQQQDFLNEDSEYYDAEAAELVEDILSTISVSMIYEGYSVSAVIGFLADSSEEDILEKYLSFNESVLSESTVSEDYAEEQLQQLDEFLGAALRIAGAGLKAAKYAKGAKGLAPLARLGSGLQGAGKAASRVAQQGTKASAVVRPAISKAVTKVKDIAKGAKSISTNPVAKNIAKGAGIFGLGAAGGFVGAKMAGAGSGGSQKPTDSSKQTPSTIPPESAKPPKAEVTTPKAPEASGGGSKASSGGGSKVSAPAAKPKSQDKPKSGETPMQQWARLNPKLAAKVKPGQSGYEEISQTRVKPSSYEKQDQTPTQGSSTAQINANSIEADIKAEQERTKKRMEQQKSSTTTTKESYEPYDILLDYLIDRGHADSLEEAHYIMLEMDESAVGVIMEEYENYILAEEVSKWVDGLLEEGYDLSEYTWDDIIEYYVNEAREDEGLTPLQKIRKRNKEYFRNFPDERQQTSTRRAELSSQRGVKKSKGEKSAFGTMRHVGGPYK